jgi:type VI secretion system secreted protein Hcp
MKPTAYLQMVGQKQGQITGSVTSAPHRGTIEVIATAHEIVSPRDAASGLPTGKRMHKPFIITKELDRSSPLLYNLLNTNENITTWELGFWRPSANGGEKQYYSVQLTNASISSITFGLSNQRNPDLDKKKAYEEIAFTYHKITWTWVDGAITAEDDWEASVS